jgi:hypothetical protein
MGIAVSSAHFFWCFNFGKINVNQGFFETEKHVDSYTIHELESVIPGLGWSRSRYNHEEVESTDRGSNNQHQQPANNKQPNNNRKRSATTTSGPCFFRESEYHFPGNCTFFLKFS